MLFWTFWKQKCTSYEYPLRVGDAHCTVVLYFFGQYRVQISNLSVLHLKEKSIKFVGSASCFHQSNLQGCIQHAILSVVFTFNDFLANWPRYSKCRSFLVLAVSAIPHAAFSSRRGMTFALFNAKWEYNFLYTKSISAHIFKKNCAIEILYRTRDRSIW